MLLCWKDDGEREREQDAEIDIDMGALGQLHHAERRVADYR